MANRLKEKVAVITGAASGIGRASAKAFAREGAQLVLADVDEKGGHAIVAEIEKDGGTAAFTRADVSKAADAEAMIAFTEKRFGRLNVLFNNAGIMPPGDDSVLDTDEAVFDRVMAVNVNASTAFRQCCAPAEEC
jgi:NAD(P)-dependent dehydrogenase (short-subunit alcohol dehydrogenase family)